MSKKETRKTHTPAAEPGGDRTDVYTRVIERIFVQSLPAQSISSPFF